MQNAETQTGTKKILLVEEDANFRKVLRYFLFGMGLEVEEAKDGRTALERCLSVDFALVLADANTPIMGILCFVSAVKRHRPNLPIVIISAFSSEENKARAFRAGAIEFLEKPCDPILFRHTIGRLVNPPANIATCSALGK